MTTRTRDEGRTVAVVLSGAAARGAFQAGALAELLPVLEQEGLTPKIVLGTSAGAINAALYGSLSHLDGEQAGRGVEDVWRRMDHSNVFRPIPVGFIRPTIQFGSGFLLGLGSGTTSLLDTTPLTETAERELDARRLHANVAGDGTVSKVGVIATRIPPATTQLGTSSGHTVVFLDERERSDYDGDEDRALAVARGALGPEHVVASAAIPIAFPPQLITEPSSVAGWYGDGGVRLNAPLKPAISLGATHIIVISATSTEHRPDIPPTPGVVPPDAADTGAQVMNAMLADRLIEDLRTIERTNRLVRHAADNDMPPLPSRSGGTYGKIRFTTIAPGSGEMGRLATSVHDDKTSGLRSVREFDNWILGRALRGIGDSTGRRELLSYLLFDDDYFEASLDIGRRAARAALESGWRTEPDEPNEPIKTTEPPERPRVRIAG